MVSKYGFRNSCIGLHLFPLRILDAHSIQR